MDARRWTAKSHCTCIFATHCANIASILNCCVPTMSTYVSCTTWPETLTMARGGDLAVRLFTHDSSRKWSKQRFPLSLSSPLSLQSSQWAEDCWRVRITVAVLRISILHVWYTIQPYKYEIATQRSAYSDVVMMLRPTCWYMHHLTHIYHSNNPKGSHLYGGSKQHRHI